MLWCHYHVKIEIVIANIILKSFQSHSKNHPIAIQTLKTIMQNCVGEDGARCVEVHELACQCIATRGQLMCDDLPSNSGVNTQ